jgi:hypothetical protein
MMGVSGFDRPHNLLSEIIRLKMPQIDKLATENESRYKP